MKYIKISILALVISLPINLFGIKKQNKSLLLKAQKQIDLLKNTTKNIKIIGASLISLGIAYGFFIYNKKLVLPLNKKKLVILGKKIDFKNAKKIANFLKKNQTLKHLTLSSCEIDDSCLKPIVKALFQNNSLIKLDLEDNVIGIKGAKQISKFLKTNTTLQILNLKANIIKFEGTKKIIKTLLKHNKSLLELDIEDNLIDIKETTELQQILNKNQNLTKWNLGFQLSF